MLERRTFIFGDGRIHTHADPTRGPCARPRPQRGQRNRFNSSDFGLLGEQSSPKWETPCPRRRWTAVQNLTPLAFSRRREP